MALQTIMAHAQRHRRMLGCIAGAVLLFCCIVPRRTESYFRTELPRRGDRPVNNSPVDLPVPEGVESFVNCIGMRMIRVPAGDFVMGSPTTENGRSGIEPQHMKRIGRTFAIANKSVRDFELYEDGRLTSLKVAWKE